MYSLRPPWGGGWGGGGGGGGCWGGGVGGGVFGGLMVWGGGVFFWVLEMFGGRVGMGGLATFTRDKLTSSCSIRNVVKRQIEESRSEEERLDESIESKGNDR